MGLRPSEVLDHQHTFMCALQSENGIQYMANLIQTMDERHSTKEYFIEGETHARTLAEQYCERTSLATKAAYAFWVSEDMIDLVGFAGDQLPDISHLEHEDLPSECGFALFEKPFEMTARETQGSLPHLVRTEQIMRIHGFMWRITSGMDGYGQSHPGIVLTVLVNMQDNHAQLLAELDKTGLDMDEELRIASKTTGESDIYKRDQIEQVIAEFRRTFGMYSIDQFMLLPFAMRIGPVKTNRNLMRLFLSFVLMLDQVIVDVSEEKPQRHFARRARRHGLPERVNVIRLRRAKRDTHLVGETSVEWSHRWYVRGHWRNQPYGPGRSQTKRIWISDHIKGPDDKPLVITDKVYALVR